MVTANLIKPKRISECDEVESLVSLDYMAIYESPLFCKLPKRSNLRVKSYIPNNRSIKRARVINKKLVLKDKHRTIFNRFLNRSCLLEKIKWEKNKWI